MSKQIYPSKYTDKQVTDAQYLCDEVCERIAKKDGKVLPYKYWNSPDWNKIYRRQIGEATKLLKEIDCVTVMAFLRSKKGRNIYSLGLKTQIIEGCRNMVKLTAQTTNKNNDVFPVDVFVEISVDEDEIKLEHKGGVSLWEQLQ